MIIVDQYVNQTEDIDLEITVLQNNGLVLDMSPAAEVYLVITDGYKVLWSKYTKNNAAGSWLPLDASQSNAGIIKVRLFSTLTKTMRPGRYYANLRVRYTSQASTDDLRYDIVEREYVFSIRESIYNNLTPLP